MPSYGGESRAACIYNRSSADLVARLVSEDTPSYCNGTSFNAVGGQVSPALCVSSGPYLRHINCIYKADAGL